MTTLTTPELHSLHARTLSNAAACRRDYAKGGTLWHTPQQALRSARSMIDAARNARECIAARIAHEARP